jgi:SAM-dependent MidA family methyltransferase
LTPVDARVRAEIERRGPIPFEEVVEAALYDPDGGFYATGGRAGRRGDFLTSPEVGPLFGAVIGRALDDWWAAAGHPDAFAVVEVGAGPGTLARTVLASAPACAPALRYVLVESSSTQRALHAAHLPLEDPAAAFASTPEPDEEREGRTPAMPAGAIVVSLSDLPRLPGPAVVIANELLDNLPFGLLERTTTGWSEVRVGFEADHLIEVLTPSPVEPGVDAEVGARIPRQGAAAAWVAEAHALAGPDGRVLAIDYTATTPELAARPWPEWVRTYRGHQRGGPPLHALGTQDITCEVAVDQLPPPTTSSSQADWLRRHGIDDLVDEGRQIWRERAGIGDLAAVRARSRVREAEALLDPEGLGAFRVLEWHR